MATAKHRAIDLLRRQQAARAQARGARPRARGSSSELAAPDLDAALDDDVGDDLLRLIFTACHPVLSTEARVALTLRLLGGLTTEEIARAFLVARADGRAAHRPRQADAGRDAACRSRCPRGAELAARLSSVLEVIYLVFNEGYSATAGDDWMRPALCEDALRLGRILAELAPQRAGGPRPRRADGDPGVARAGARRPVGRADPAARSEPRALGSRCSSVAASRRSSAPRRSAARTARTRCRPRSPPVTPARARPRRPTGRASRRSTTRSPQLAPSPVVELNRAVAVAMAFGPAAGLELVDALDRGAVARGLPPPAERARRPARRSSAASTRRARSSSAPRRSRATPASASCSSRAPPPARVDRRSPRPPEPPRRLLLPSAVAMRQACPMDAAVTIAQFAKMLKNLDRWLEAASAFAEKKKFEPDVLAQARLAPDQYPLVRQVQSACDSAKFAAAYLSGKKAPVASGHREDASPSCARASATCVAYLESVQPSAFAGADERRVAPPWLQGKWMRGDRLPRAGRGAELLLPRDDGVRDPAPQRRRPRQDGLHRLDARPRRLTAATLCSAAPSGAPTLRRQNRTSVAMISSSDAICPPTGDSGPTSDSAIAPTTAAARQLRVLVRELAGRDALREAARPCRRQ